MDINNLREGKVALDFVKMQTCGNDYIYFDCLNKSIENPDGLSISFTDHHYGIGADGTIIILPSHVADAKMRMFNRDGSEGKMCANGVRCVAKYLYDSGIVQKKTMEIETYAGIRHAEVTVQRGKVTKVKVDMGKAEFAPALVPMKPEKGMLEKSAAADGRIIGLRAKLAGEETKITCVSVGNPHCVIFMDDAPFDLDQGGLARIGSAIENDPMFPERTNVEFVHVIDDHTLIVKVWERGNGETYACGSGACAAVAAAVENGLCRADKPVIVHLKGGDMVVECENGEFFITGETVEVYRGTVEI